MSNVRSGVVVTVRKLANHLNVVNVLRHRANNNLRDWLDENGVTDLPKGEYGVDGWVNDAATVERVRERYPPPLKMRPRLDALSSYSLPTSERAAGHQGHQTQ